jgi:hypothetical protein
VQFSVALPPWLWTQLPAALGAGLAVGLQPCHQTTISLTYSQRAKTHRNDYLWCVTA